MIQHLHTTPSAHPNKGPSQCPSPIFLTLLTTTPINPIHIFLVMKTFKIHSLNNFKIYMEYYQLQSHVLNDIFCFHLLDHRGYFLWMIHKLAKLVNFNYPKCFSVSIEAKLIHSVLTVTKRETSMLQKVQRRAPKMLTVMQR